VSGEDCNRGKGWDIPKFEEMSVVKQSERKKVEERANRQKEGGGVGENQPSPYSAQVFMIIYFFIKIIGPVSC
jgi:hypothetical protein